MSISRTTATIPTMWELLLLVAASHEVVIVAPLLLLLLRLLVTSLPATVATATAHLALMLHGAATSVGVEVSIATVVVSLVISL